MKYIIHKIAQYTSHKHVNMTQINHIFTDIKKKFKENNKI